MRQGIFASENSRTVRLKRSKILVPRIEEIDRPTVKVAGEIDEFKDAFSLVHDNYLRNGYLDTPKPHGMLFGIHALLPGTVVFVAKSNKNVISTISEIADTEPFGLPMDELYRGELDELRARGRKIVELSALVTPADYRWTNVVMYICKVMYQYSIDHGINDLCIAVNPKHVRFYKHILLFEDLGPERYYPKVNAPAVALRVNLDVHFEKTKSVYDGCDFDCNVHTYFYGREGSRVPAENGKSCWTLENVEYFLSREKSILEGLSQSQREFFLKSYPGLTIP
ncbi:MAG: N-acyl amino acid synthase FeeM domain-containing protein [Syntrophobacteraceae bacterium]